MNTHARAALTAVAMWALLCGCVLLRPNEPEEETPEPEYEGCSDDHAQFWSPNEGVEIIVDSGLAERECNEIRFHSGFAGQGGDVFHIEPRVRATGDAAALRLEAVTWETFDMDGDLLNAQGFEIFDQDLTAVDGGVEFRARVQINVSDRGKNLRLRAITTRAGAAEPVIVGAAAYVSGPE